jgi:hypothetical protein
MVVSSTVQQVYEDHIASLSAAERLELVELITRGFAPIPEQKPVEAAIESLRQMPGWQGGERGRDATGWRDRAL